MFLSKLFQDTCFQRYLSMNFTNLRFFRIYKTACFLGLMTEVFLSSLDLIFDKDQTIRSKIFEEILYE